MIVEMTIDPFHLEAVKEKRGVELRDECVGFYLLFDSCKQVRYTGLFIL